MSIWSDMHRRSTGNSVRKEDKTEEIRQLKAYISQKFENCTLICNDIKLANKKLQYYNMPPIWNPYENDLEIIKEKFVEIMKSYDADELKKFSLRCSCFIFNAKNHLDGLDGLIHTEEQMEKQSRAKRMEELRKREEQRKKEQELELRNKRICRFIGLGIAVVATIAAIIFHHYGCVNCMAVSIFFGIGSFPIIFDLES